MSEQPKIKAHRAYEKAWGDWNPGVFDEVCAPDFIYHESKDHDHNLGEYRELTEEIHASYSDMRIDIEDMLAEGDQVAARGTLTLHPASQATGTSGDTAASSVSRTASSPSAGTSPVDWGSDAATRAADPVAQAVHRSPVTSRLDPARVPPGRTRRTVRTAGDRALSAQEHWGSLGFSHWCRGGGVAAQLPDRRCLP